MLKPVTMMIVEAQPDGIYVNGHRIDDTHYTFELGGLRFIMGIGEPKRNVFMFALSGNEIVKVVISIEVKIEEVDHNSVMVSRPDTDPVLLAPLQQIGAREDELHAIDA